MVCPDEELKGRSDGVHPWLQFSPTHPVLIQLVDGTRRMADIVKGRNKDPETNCHTTWTPGNKVRSILLKGYCMKNIFNNLEAADFIRVHPNTLSRWAREGRINYTQVGGNRRVFSRKDLEDFIAPLTIPVVGEEERPQKGRMFNMEAYIEQCNIAAQRNGTEALTPYDEMR